MIAAGRVTVNGRPAELGSKADPDRDQILLDGKPIKPAADRVYIVLNKPPGYTTTRSDPHAERTILDLVKDIDAFVYPVGRLDRDTAGLVILTNDGEFANTLTHPSHEIEKTYRAIVRGRISASSLARLGRGIELDDGPTAPAKARLISYSEAADRSTVDLTIHEGRKRQVRRMFASVGHPVSRLTRTRIGSLELKGLHEGAYRLLTKPEVTRLRRSGTL